MAARRRPLKAAWVARRLNLPKLLCEKPSDQTARSRGCRYAHRPIPADSVLNLMADILNARHISAKRLSRICQRLLYAWLPPTRDAIGDKRDQQAKKHENPNHDPG